MEAHDRGDGGEMATPNMQPRHSDAPPPPMNPLSSSPAIPRLPLAELAEKQKAAFPFNPALHTASANAAARLFPDPTGPVGFAPPAPIRIERNAAVMNNNPSQPQPTHVPSQQQPTTAADGQAATTTAAPSVMSPTPRNKRELLSAARDKLKEVRDEERDISTVYIRAVQARDEVRRAGDEGVSSLEDRTEHIKAAVIAMNCALGLGTTSSGAGSPTMMPGTTPLNATPMDAVPEAVITSLLRKRLEAVKNRTEALQREHADLKELQETKLNPLEKQVKVAEAKYTAWQRMSADREAEIGTVRQAISAKLQEIKAVEEWMRGYVMMPAETEATIYNNLKTSSPPPQNQDDLPTPATLAIALGLRYDASHAPNALQKKRDELLAAIAMADQQLARLQAIAAQHEDEIIIADLQSEVTANEQLLQSYRVRMNALEKERRKRPKRTDVGERLNMAREQARHLKAEYARQVEDLGLLLNKFNNATASYLSPQRSRTAGLRRGGGDPTVTTPGSSSINTPTSRLDSSDVDSSFGGAGSGSPNDGGGLPPSVSPVTMVVRKAALASRQYSHQNGGGTDSLDTTASTIAFANTNAGGAYGLDDTTNIDVSVGGGNTEESFSTANLLQARCNELQYALSTYRDATLPDLRRQFGELKGVAFDEGVLQPEAWEAEERRHKVHIAAMEDERNTLQRTIAEHSAQIVSMQERIQVLAAAASSKARAKQGRFGSLLGYLATPLRIVGRGGVAADNNQNKPQPKATVGANLADYTQSSIVLDDSHHHHHTTADNDAPQGAASTGRPLDLSAVNTAIGGLNATTMGLAGGDAMPHGAGRDEAGDSYSGGAVTATTVSDTVVSTATPSNHPSSTMEFSSPLNDGGHAAAVAAVLGSSIADGLRVVSPAATPFNSVSAPMPQIHQQQQSQQMSAAQLASRSLAANSAGVPYPFVGGSYSAYSKASLSALGVGIDKEAIGGYFNYSNASTNVPSSLGIAIHHSEMVAGLTKAQQIQGGDAVAIKMPSLSTTVGSTAPACVSVGMPSLSATAGSVAPSQHQQQQQNAVNTSHAHVQQQPPSSAAAPSMFYRVATLPVSVFAFPYMAARETLKKFAAPPPEGFEQRQRERSMAAAAYAVAAAPLPAAAATAAEVGSLPPMRISPPPQATPAHDLSHNASMAVGQYAMSASVAPVRASPSGDRGV